MTPIGAALLCLAVASCWLSTLAFLRLKTALERIHVVTFVNVVVLGAIALGGFASNGLTAQTLKLGLLWLVNLATGSLLSHATARAIHFRGGEAR